MRREVHSEIQAHQKNQKNQIRVSRTNPTPLCPGDASCNNNDGYAITGTNVGRLIILFGSLLMLIGGLVLRRGYRY